MVGVVSVVSGVSGVSGVGGLGGVVKQHLQNCEEHHPGGLDMGDVGYIRVVLHRHQGQLHPGAGHKVAEVQAERDDGKLNQVGESGENPDISLHTQEPPGSAVFGIDNCTSEVHSPVKELNPLHAGHAHVEEDPEEHCEGDELECGGHEDGGAEQERDEGRGHSLVPHSDHPVQFGDC